MRHKSFDTMQCPIARGLEHVGEWWSILILRDAFRGLRRFDDFRDSLGIAPTMLTKRLNTLVEAGLLARRQYSEHPPRDEYVLTPVGKDFRPVLLAMMAFGNRHFPPDSQTVRIVNQQTGEPVDPVFVDPATGQRVDGPGYAVVTTPLQSGPVQSGPLETAAT
jgi:DNA-binding HxlR family transcriptional regulator